MTASPEFSSLVIGLNGQANEVLNMPSVFGILLFIDFESSFMSSAWSFWSLLRWCDAGLAGLSGLIWEVSLLLFTACWVIGFDAIGGGGGGDDVTALDSIELHSTKVDS